MPLRAGFCSSTGELSGLALVVAPHLLSFCERTHHDRSCVDGIILRDWNSNSPIYEHALCSFSHTLSVCTAIEFVWTRLITKLWHAYRELPLDHIYSSHTFYGQNICEITSVPGTLGLLRCRMLTTTGMLKYTNGFGDPSRIRTGDILIDSQAL